VSLSLELALPARALRGEFMIASVRVRNRGGPRTSVRARLNLFEGDLRLLLTDPAGQTRSITGVYQPDTPLRQVELQPDEFLESGLSLSYTNVGFTFPDAGEYQLIAEYDSGGASGRIRSDPAQIAVMEPVSDEDRALAALTTAEDVAQLVALGGCGAGAETRARLEEIADRFGTRKEGAIAALALLADAARSGLKPEERSRNAGPTAVNPFQAADPVTVALWVSSLATPVNPSAGQLIEAFLADLRRRRAARDDTRVVEYAAGIAQQQPVRAP
jgi:hypothetical protein